MKTLQERTQIAKAMNFGKYPVLTMDLAKMDDNGGLYKSLMGCKVRIDIGKDYYDIATICVFEDKHKLTTMSENVCLKAGFGYNDIVEMAENANAPIIKADQDVLLVITNSETKTAYAPVIIHTGKEINRFCSTPIHFEDVDLGWIFNL